MLRSLLKQTFTITLLLGIIFFEITFAEDIPVIVISPSKSPQSISTVGTSVKVLTEKDLENSNNIFLGDTINNSMTGLNFFQTGGYGNNMGIQLRGLPKAYSTVYIDGVKKSDASTPKNDFYFDDIVTGQVSRVEILKGNQSSIYGSGAMGGAINLFSKQGKGEFKRDFNYQAGSNNLHNFNLSYGGSDNEKDFYLGIQRFQTDGESAMNHNDEDDSYMNHTFLTNYGYKFSENFDLRAIYKFTDSVLHYDAIISTFNQIDNSSHEKDSSGTLKFNYKVNENLKSNLTLNTSYMSRTSDNVINQFYNEVIEQDYWSYRNTVSFDNNYKINSNNNIIFGFEKEFEEMRYNPYEHQTQTYSPTDYRKGEEITSQYMDLQSKITDNLYGTLGIRFDQHSQSLDEDSERASLAYLSDSLGAKFKASYGTGIKFPSLYEYANSGSPESLVAEHGRSFDFGVEKSFIEKGLDFDLTFFNHKYEDTIEGWKAAGWTPKNMPGVVRTRGLELLSNFKPRKDLRFNLAYTYNSTYDGADFDDPDLGPGSAGDFLNSQLVRVPRHLVNLGLDYNLNNNSTLTWKTKWSDTARDYGNGNAAGGNYRDVRLDSYLVNDLEFNVKIGEYRGFATLTNIFDEKYSHAIQYSAPKRALNFGFKKLY